MKRFIAIPNDSNTIKIKDKVLAKEAKFDIVAISEDIALELIEEEGENSIDFDLVYISEAKNQMGKYFNKSITKLY